MEPPALTHMLLSTEWQIDSSCSMILLAALMKALVLASMMLVPMSFGATVVVGTDFSGRTVTGATANNVTFTTDGIDSPGNSVTAVENEANGVNDATTENGGLFNTGAANGFLALDLNIDNEDGWYFDVPIVLSAQTVSIGVTTLDITFNHFSNSGAAQGNAAVRSDHRAQIIGSVSGVAATDEVLNVGGANAAGPYLQSLDLTTTLDSSESWTLRIFADYNGGQGNNVGYDAFALNGNVVVPEPTSALLIALGGACLLRRRR